MNLTQGIEDACEEDDAIDILCQMQELTYQYLSNPSESEYVVEIQIPVELSEEYDDLKGQGFSIIYEVFTNYFSESMAIDVTFVEGINPTPPRPIMLPNPLLGEYNLGLGQRIDHDFGIIVFDLARTPYADVLVEQVSVLNCVKTDCPVMRVSKP